MRKSLIVFLIILFIPVSTAFGHGFGIDTISSVPIDGKKISITVQMPTYFEDSSDEKLIITAINDADDLPAENVTFLVGLFHENEMIFRNYFFAPQGVLDIALDSTDGDTISIIGNQDSLLGAWHAKDSEPIIITGPVFESGGLYNFEIEIRTIDQTTNIIQDAQIYYADVSVVETSVYPYTDLNGTLINFNTKSYFDTISNFKYNSTLQQVKFEMPFDWSEKEISHIPVVHQEIHFPKNFVEFFKPSYTGKVNGIDLFKSSITIDDYSQKDQRVVHFVLLTDHLRFLKTQMEKSGQTIPDKMEFILDVSDDVVFPMSAMTLNEEFQIDLSWDPIAIIPEATTKFIFSVRDGSTGSLLRHSTYDFVILQNGNEIHRSSGNAKVGGDFVDYTFSKDQIGPTIIRFENIRGTDLDTEFGIVVAPEFATTIVILSISLVGVLIASRKITRINYPL